METLVTFSVQDGVGVITIDNPPVNALSSGPGSGCAAVNALERDAEARAIVIIGAGRTFVAGADINHLSRLFRGGEGNHALCSTPCSTRSRTAPNLW